MYKKTVLVLVLLFIVQNVSCQSTRTIANEECQLFMKPILGFDLELFTPKEEALSLFDTNRLDERIRELVPHTQKQFYYVDKKVQLEGKGMVDLIGKLGFEEGRLVYVEVDLMIGRDKEFYFALMNELEKLDKEQVNVFAYKTERFLRVDKKSGCDRSFSFQRSVYSPENYCISISLHR